MITNKQSAGQFNRMQEELEPGADLLGEMVRAVVQEVLDTEVTRHLEAQRHERTPQV
jgi:transposase-like protein